MRVKRYVGRNMSEAVAQVRAEFGRNAVILQTRRVREPGFWGLLGRRRVEVLAALESERRRGGQAPVKAAERSSTRPADPRFTQLREKLIALGFLPADADALLAEAGVGQRNATGDGDGVSSWRTELTRLVAGRIPTVEPWRLDNPPCFHALIGPTGVGKTTTVAKLAANYRLIMEREVGLIAADLYRIGAVDQLREYAELIGAPVEVVHNAREMEKAVERLAHLDLVLIDTMGSNQRDAQRLGELQELLAAAPRAECHLVVSATTRLPDLQDIIARFSRLRPASLIVTKMDETTCPVTVFNAVRIAGKPLLFVTTGQSVPEDIEAPQPGAVAEAIVSGLV